MIKTYNVNGMTCGHCVSRITNEINTLEGIREVNVSLEKKTINVDYDEKAVKSEKIIEAIVEAGYDLI